ncbi:MAG: hypothetical protein COB79_01555 [Zetaproteobacteria bacterium]|nr:MAG: hypothetical protein COB79_01555 [Zetaproteobacteria bacterium]
MIFGMSETVLNVVFNGVLVVAILGLWGMWFYQGRQRKKVESLLKQASADLQQATMLLDQVMTQMTNIERDKASQIIARSAQEDKQATPKPSVTRRNHQQLKQPRAKVKPTTTHAPQEVNLAAKIMRLKREGLDMQRIAQTLSLPIAQVRLMLLLQTAKA